MEITLQSLLDEIARDGGDLATLLRQYTDEGHLTSEQITSLITEARTSFETARAGELNEAVIGELETLAAGIQALDAEAGHLSEVAETRAAQVAEIAARAGLEDSTAAPEGDGDAAAEGGDAAEGDAQDGAEAAGTDSAGDTPAADAGAGEQTAGTTEPEAIAASTAPAIRAPRRRVNLSDINRRTPRVTPPPAEGETRPFGGALVAAAGVDGVRSGHQFGSWFDVGALAAGIMDSVGRSGMVASAIEAGRPGGREFYERSGLVQLRREYGEGLIVMDDQADSKAILDRAANVALLEDRDGNRGVDALVAATGWCAPSETLYELCELPCALEGILSLPEIGAPRGGVRWTSGIDFCDIYAAAGYFHYTEAQLMADPAPTKPCMEIPCVDFNECRLEVDGMCITGDIPQARAYPEVVSQFLQGATCARAHRTNALKIARIAAGSQNDGAVTFAPMGATASVLNAIDLKIMEYRYRGLRAQDGAAAILEMVVPFWLRGVIRGDIANRNGYANPFDVTNAQIDLWFRSRGVIPRWVYDYQALPAVCAVPPAAPITAWPESVEVIIYEAGTWVAATQDVISLENLYDSTLIRQNKFTALFVEDAFCLLNRCNGSIRFQIPICPSGNTGAQVEFTCGAPAGFAGLAAPFSPELVGAEVAGMNNGPQLPEGSTIVTPAADQGSTGDAGSTTPQDA